MYSSPQFAEDHMASVPSTVITSRSEFIVGGSDARWRSEPLLTSFDSDLEYKFWLWTCPHRCKKFSRHLWPHHQRKSTRGTAQCRFIGNKPYHKSGWSRECYVINCLKPVVSNISLCVSCDIYFFWRLQATQDISHKPEYISLHSKCFIKDF